MKKNLVAAGVLMCALVTPALADYYIVQDTGTRRCTIVEQRPTVTTQKIVGPDGSDHGHEDRESVRESLRSIARGRLCDRQPPNSGGPRLAVGCEMDERITLRILGWVVGSVVLSCFVLGAVSLPH